MSTVYHDSIPDASGIYRITCTTTGKFYIGSTINLRKRWRDHSRDLQQNTHHNPKLQRAWDKYGQESFTFEVIELVLPISLTSREQHWFNKLKPFGDKGFNIATIAGSTLGRKASEATCMKISAATKGRVAHNRGKKATPETIEKLRNSRPDYKHSEATKRKMSEARKGRTISAESIEKFKRTMAGRPANPVAHAKLTATKMKTFIVTAPDGTEYVAHGLRQFCREHSLDCSNLVRVAQGKQVQYKGWKARYLDIGES